MSTDSDKQTVAVESEVVRRGTASGLTCLTAAVCLCIAVLGLSLFAPIHIERPQKDAGKEEQAGQERPGDITLRLLRLREAEKKGKDKEGEPAEEPKELGWSGLCVEWVKYHWSQAYSIPREGGPGLFKRTGWTSVYLELLKLTTRHSVSALTTICIVDAVTAALLCLTAILMLIFGGLPGRRALPAVLATVRFLVFLASFIWLLAWSIHQPGRVGDLCANEGVRQFLTLAFLSGVLCPVALLLANWRPGRWFEKALAAWSIVLLVLALPAAATYLQPMLRGLGVLTWLVIAMEVVIAGGLLCSVVGFARGAEWSTKALLRTVSLRLLACGLGVLYLAGSVSCGRPVLSDLTTGYLGRSVVPTVFLASSLGPALTLLILLFSKQALESVKALGLFNVLIGLLGLPIAAFIMFVKISVADPTAPQVPSALRMGLGAAPSLAVVFWFLAYFALGVAILRRADRLGRKLVWVLTGLQVFYLFVVVATTVSSALTFFSVGSYLFYLGVGTLLPPLLLGLIGAQVVDRIRGIAVACLTIGIELLIAVPGGLGILGLILFRQQAGAQIFDSNALLYWIGFSAATGVVAALLLIVAARALWREKPLGRRLCTLFAASVLAISVFDFVIKLGFVVPRLEALELPALMDVPLTAITLLSLFGIIAFPIVLSALMNLRSIESRLRYPNEQAEGRTDAVIDNLRTWGLSPRFRKSWVSSFLFHALVILGPLLLLHLGCIEPYRLPFGGGDRPQAEKKKVKIKKVKKKKFLINPYASIIWEAMKPEEMKLDLDEDTAHTWSGRKGGRGKGAGSGYGKGWPGGRVRFIRLKYSGGDWDQDMGIGADNNMLKQFYKRTKIPCKDRTESLDISDLVAFPKNQSPPFVYITGKRGLNAGDREIKVLREYLLKRNGMLFADNGGGYFHHAFDRLVRRLFPRKPWVDIPDDDEVYTCYYELPYGAPPLWHHSGTRALGIKHEGRWIVFYHQGDVNDAWKDGHSGTSEENAELAYQLGCNVMHYSFIKYLDWVEAMMNE